jgi:hypothetical protein
MYSSAGVLGRLINDKIEVTGEYSGQNALLKNLAEQRK